MNSKCYLALNACLTIAAVFFAANAAEKTANSGVLHFDHDRVEAVFAKGGVLLATNNFKIMGLRRDKAGEAEIHDNDTDVIYVLEGSATFVTGGQPTEPRTTGPGETRGKSITGGEEQKLVKGDVIVVPNRVPHWFKEVNAPFLYFVVKVSK